MAPRPVAKAKGVRLPDYYEGTELTRPQVTEVEHVNLGRNYR
jgi:hypothetical protein